MRTSNPGPPARRAPCRLTIDYETRRVQRQCEFLALLGLDTPEARAAARYWKRAEWAGIRRLQRAEAKGQPVPARSQCFLQARRGGVLPRKLIITRGPDSRIRARMESPP